MANEKDKQENEELGKTMVMSLSTLSTEVEEVLKEDKHKKNKSSKKTTAKKVEKSQAKEVLVKEKPVSTPQMSAPIEVVKGNEDRSTFKVEKEIIEEKQTETNTKEDRVVDEQAKKPETKEPLLTDVKENAKEDGKEKAKEDRKETSKDIADISINDNETSPKAEEIAGETRVAQKLEKGKNEKAEKAEDKADRKETVTNEPTQTIHDLKQDDLESIKEEEAKKETKLTLEEKRRNERSNLMTIEERRALQKEGKLPTSPDEKKRLSDHMGKIDYVLLLLSMLMSWFVTYRIFSYFSWGYALIFFLIMHALFAGIFFLSKKKRKIGLGINIAMSILTLLLSLLMFKMNDFTDQIFDNSESEMVMLVAKKDSTITENDDFKDKKIAFIKSDGDTNSFAKEMLSEAKKDTYQETVYVTYKEAYEALVNNDVDMMVYTSFTKQRLAEDEIQSWDEIKVIMQKSRALKAVESKQVDISNDPFNIYISGVDLTSYSINEKGSSDVNIIMTVNPQTEKIIMQTIPRDTWAGLTCSNDEHTKLTYAGAYGGIDCSINTIEAYLGIDINYYAKINFQGVIDLVDALGGITVNSDVSFCESHPVEGYGVRNYCYNAGVNTLSGIDALMFARIRKVFADGDVERGRHQMEVVNAVIRKFSESPSLSNINALLGAVEDNFTTNLEEEDIGKGLELFLGMGDRLTNIETVTMEGSLQWKTDEVTNEYLYYFIPNDGQVDLVKQRIQDVMDGK